MLPLKAMVLSQGNTAGADRIIYSLARSLIPLDSRGGTSVSCAGSTVRALEIKRCDSVCLPRTDGLLGDNTSAIAVKLLQSVHTFKGGMSMCVYRFSSRKFESIQHPLSLIFSVKARSEVVLEKGHRIYPSGGLWVWPTPSLPCPRSPGLTSPAHRRGRPAPCKRFLGGLSPCMLAAGCKCPE